MYKVDLLENYIDPAARHWGHNIGIFKER